MLEEFPYLTVTATCSGEHTGCCYGFDTGELTYGGAFQPSVYTGSEEEHVSRSYISADVKDGCYRTVTLEAVTRSGVHPSIALEGLYLSEGRSQGFDTGESVGNTPALSVGRFFYVGNIGEVSQAEFNENNLVLSAAVADYTITVKLTKESAASSLEQQDNRGAEQGLPVSEAGVQPESIPAEVIVEQQQVSSGAETQGLPVDEAGEQPVKASAEVIVEQQTGQQQLSEATAVAGQGDDAEELTGVQTFVQETSAGTEEGTSEGEGDAQAEGDVASSESEPTIDEREPVAAPGA